MIDALLAALSHGASYESAARKAGVSPGTFRRWRARDPQFAQAVRDAEAKLETTLATALRDTGERWWRANA